MLQAIQHQKTGELQVQELPTPTVKPGFILVRTHASLISAGTERTSVATAKASLVEKARSRPDLVKQVLDTARKEGVMNTVEKVRSRLNSYKSLGYSASGVVIESGCDEFSPGDRVACAGAGYAVHAEVISVPKNLAAPIPDNVTFEDAAFTTLSSIAMQGVRQARVSLGESVAVIGLGLLGQITVQLLKAAGCRVIGLDINEHQFQLAREFGIDATAHSGPEALPIIESFTRGLGCDAVIITAATSGNGPMELAIQAARKRGRVVVVGSIGMNLPRSPFYEKELEITIACSYGPGRYDPHYEEEGHDYPAGFVRWTEGRNMVSVLDLVSAGKLNVVRMITHRFPIADAAKAYDLITGEVKEPYLGILLLYPDRGPEATARTVRVNSRRPAQPGSVGVGFIGAGSFAQGHLIPHIRKDAQVRLVAVTTSTAVNARSVAEQFGFEDAATDASTILSNAAVEAVFVATRHDSHARYVLDAVRAGKDVFVEKPLAIDREGLAEIRAAVEEKGGRVMVGFNRRFSEPVRAISDFFRPIGEPLVMTYRVNAGFIPPEHWIMRPEQGSRIIGEVCHFIDTMQYLTGARPVSVYAASLASENTTVRNSDSVSIVVRFSDGSVGTVIYLANGSPGVPKEYLEVFGGGMTAIMENFKTVTFWRGRKPKISKYSGAKGHCEEVAATLAAMKGGGPMPISFESLHDTTLATFAAMESLGNGGVVRL